MSAHERQSTADALNALENGTVEVVGRLPYSSNFALLVDVAWEETSMHAVYKPEQGEQELWDFPPGIWKREVATFELSHALGWTIIPPTVARNDAPFGPGSLQQFINADFEQHYFTIYEAGQHEDHLQQLAVLDIIANNTDRKSGHVLLSEANAIFGIDNALCFHHEPKLRTVIWEFQNTPIPEPLIDDIHRLIDTPPETVTKWLGDEEQQAFVERIQALSQNPVFPELVWQRQLPWPLV